MKLLVDTVPHHAGVYLPAIATLSLVAAVHIEMMGSRQFFPENI